jgi:hypothetical protein
LQRSAAPYCGLEREFHVNPRHPQHAAEIPCTLLQLVTYLTGLGASDRETVEIVVDLIRSGRVRLTGNFRDHPLL